MKKLKVFIIMLIILGLVIWYYNYLDNKDDKKETKKELTEVEKLVNKDIEASYPETPREVVKLYNRIMLCYYNEDMSNEEFIKLTKQARILFDDELLEHNPYEEYFSRLCDELEEYKKNNRRISSCLIDGSRDVEYYTVEKQKYSSVGCTYYVKGDEGTTKSSEEYVLRKDEEGRWKILYWKLADKEDE